MLAKQPALPVVGATLTELNGFYEGSMPDDTTHAVGSADGVTATAYSIKTVYYRLNEGVVDAVSIAGNYMADDDLE